MSLPMAQIIEGDCVEVLKTFPQNSIDSCVTDPPYGLAFMGKKWDILNNHDSPKENGTYPKNRNAQGMRYSESNGKLMQEWHYKWAKEVFRVLKPGGYLLSFDVGCSLFPITSLSIPFPLSIA